MKSFALATMAFVLLTSIGIAAEPDYMLRDYNGVEHRLSDHRGKWVVINFWATWCPPCLEEMPELARFHADHKDRDAVVWGVDFEDITKEALENFLQRVSVNYPILGFGQQPYNRLAPFVFYRPPSSSARTVSSCASMREP
jgi:thiol-disulfide isomerase/thioredoxin